MQLQEQTGINSEAEKVNFLNAKSSVTREFLRLRDMRPDGTTVTKTYKFPSMEEAQAAAQLHQAWLGNVKGESLGEFPIEETDKNGQDVSNIFCTINVDGKKVRFNYSQPEKGGIDEEGNMYRISTRETALGFSQGVKEGHQVTDSNNKAMVDVQRVSYDHPSKNWHEEEMPSEE